MRQILLQKLRMKEYDQKQKTLAKKKKKNWYPSIIFLLKMAKL